jgi:arginase
MRRIAVLDAPSNLGLRPPTATSVPGCGKAPGALRDHGLVARLDARDAGCVTPPRYDPGDWRPGDGVAHSDEIAWYSRRLADRVGALLDAGEFPVVLGGDCSILLGSALAMRRHASALGGHIGLVYVDGHSDFRHPGNASYVGAAAGEDLALATGRGQGDLAAIENRRPYVRDTDVVVLGIRTHDEHRLDLHTAGIAYRAAPQLRAEGAARSAQWARSLLADCLGYWVHVDVDVLDPAVMPAVDAPDPGGIAYTELELLLAGLVATPHCLGVEITVFDPDYDPSGTYAAEIVETLVAGLAPAAEVTPLGRAAPAAEAVPAAMPASPDVPPAAVTLPGASAAVVLPVGAPIASGDVAAEAAPVGVTPWANEDGVFTVEAPGGDPDPPASRGEVEPPGGAAEVPPGDAAARGDADSVPPGDADAAARGDADSVPPGDADAVPPANADAAPSGEPDAVPPGNADAVPSGNADAVPSGEADAVRPGDVEATPPREAETAPPGDAGAEAHGRKAATVRSRVGGSAAEGAREPRVRPRQSLDRLNVSDMIDADRLALSRKRGGGVPLRRREPAEATEKKITEDTEHPPADKPPFAGLAEQVRAAGSGGGQVPGARTPVDPPAVPSPPPSADTA